MYRSYIYIAIYIHNRSYICTYRSYIYRYTGCIRRAVCWARVTGKQSQGRLSTQTWASGRKPHLFVKVCSSSAVNRFWSRSTW